MPTPRKRPRSAADGAPTPVVAARTRSCDKALVAELQRLGFDPVAERDGDDVSIAFLHCPFRELAEAYPELVCNLHRGICEGVVNAVGGGSVEDFATLYDHDPCRVSVAVGYAEEA